MYLSLLHASIQTASDFSDIILLASSEFSGGRTGLSSNAISPEDPLSAAYSVCFSLRDRLAWIFRIVLVIFSVWKTGGMVFRGLSAGSSMMALAAFIAIIWAGDVATEIASTVCEVDASSFAEAVEQR